MLQTDRQTDRPESWNLNVALPPVLEPDESTCPAGSVAVITTDGNSVSRPRRIGSQRSRSRAVMLKVESDAKLDVTSHSAAAATNMRV